MILIRNVAKSSLRSSQLIKDIIDGRNRSFEITLDKRIMFIESLATDRAEIASGTIMNRTRNRIEDSMINLFQLIAFDFSSRGMTNRAKMFTDV